MTSDEKRLLKHGLFGAVMVSGLWFLISAVHSRVVSAIGMIAWSVLLFAVFYHNRGAQKSGPR